MSTIPGSSGPPQSSPDGPCDTHRLCYGSTEERWVAFLRHRKPPALCAATKHHRRPPNPPSSPGSGPILACPSKPLTALSAKRSTPLPVPSTVASGSSAWVSRSLARWTCSIAPSLVRRARTKVDAKHKVHLLVSLDDALPRLAEIATLQTSGRSNTTCQAEVWRLSRSSSTRAPSCWPTRPQPRNSRVAFRPCCSTAIAINAHLRICACASPPPPVDAQACPCFKLWPAKTG